MFGDDLGFHLTFASRVSLQMVTPDRSPITGKADTIDGHVRFLVNCGGCAEGSKLFRGRFGGFGDVAGGVVVQVSPITPGFDQGTVGAGCAVFVTSEGER